MKFVGVMVFIFVLLIGLAVIATFVALGIFLIRALIKYIKSRDVRKEKTILKKSLGEVLKQHREECKMTQEFVAEAIGVSRQAVSKWEMGHQIPALPISLPLRSYLSFPPKTCCMRFSKPGSVFQIQMRYYQL